MIIYALAIIFTLSTTYITWYLTRLVTNVVAIFLAIGSITGFLAVSMDMEAARSAPLDQFVERSSSEAELRPLASSEGSSAYYSVDEDGPADLYTYIVLGENGQPTLVRSDARDVVVRQGAPGEQARVITREL